MTPGEEEGQSQDGLGIPRALVSGPHAGVPSPPHPEVLR